MLSCVINCLAIEHFLQLVAFVIDAVYCCAFVGQQCISQCVSSMNTDDGRVNNAAGWMLDSDTSENGMFNVLS